MAVWKVCLQNKWLRVVSPPVRFAPDDEDRQVLLYIYFVIHLKKHVCIKHVLPKLKLTSTHVSHIFLKLICATDAKIIIK